MLYILFGAALSGAVFSFLVGQSNEDAAKLAPHLLLFSVLMAGARLSRIYLSDYFFAAILVVVGLAGLLFYWRSYEHSLKSRLMPFLTSFLVLFGTCAMAHKSFFSEDDEKLAFNDELFYAKSAGFVLGKHLAKSLPGSLVLIIVDDKEQSSKVLKSGLDGLLEGLARKLRVVAVDSPEIMPPEDPSTLAGKKISPERMIHLTRKSKAEAFDNLIMKYPECNLIVSLIGLPQNPQDMALWTMDEDKRPKVALLRSGADKYMDAVYGKAIVAVVASKPGDVVGSRQKDMQAAFDERFLLITPDNIIEMASKHPEFFEK